MSLQIHDGSIIVDEGGGHEPTWFFIQKHIDLRRKHEQHAFVLGISLRYMRSVACSSPVVATWASRNMPTDSVVRGGLYLRCFLRPRTTHQEQEKQSRQQDSCFHSSSGARGHVARRWISFGAFGLVPMCFRFFAVFGFFAVFCVFRNSLDGPGFFAFFGVTGGVAWAIAPALTCASDQHGNQLVHFSISKCWSHWR